MKRIEWDKEKSKVIQEIRGISFEEVKPMIKAQNVLDVLDHPNKARYPRQKIFVVNIRNYAYIVPFVEDEEKIFLKTIIPSRKMTKIYLPERKVS